MARSDDITPDRGWAWVVVVIAACANACTYAINLSFGMLLVELTDYFGTSHAVTAWINGISESLLQLLSPVVTLLITKFDFRVVYAAGAALCVTGHILSFFTTSVYYLFFSFGIVAGTGMGLIYAAGIISVSMWFDKKLGLASGMASTGTAVGTFALSPLIELLNEKYGWRGTMLLLGGLIGQMAWLGMLMRGKRVQIPVQKLKDNEEKDRAIFQKQICESPLSIISGKAKHDIKPDITAECTNSTIDLQDKGSKGSKEIRQGVWEDQNKKATELNISAKQNKNERFSCDCFRTAVNFRLFQHKQFVVYMVAIICCYFSYVPYVFLPDKAIRLGITKQAAAFLVSIAAASSLLGRIVFGVSGDYIKRRRELFGSIILAGGIIQFVSLKCTTYWSLAIYAVVEGFTNGSIMPLNALVLKDLVGIELVADAYSLTLFFWGTTPLWKDAFVGWLFDITGDYEIPFIVIGIFLSAAGVIMLLLEPITSFLCCRCTAKSRQTFTLSK